MRTVNDDRPFGRLSYGHGARAPRRALLVAALFAFATLWYFCLPFIRLCRCRWVQWECLNYEASADAVAYASAGPAAAAVPRLEPSEAVPGDQPVVTAASATCWRELMILYAPTWWNAPGDAIPADSVLFLHSRSDPSGSRFLVHVAVAFRRDGGVQLQYELFDPYPLTGKDTIFFGSGGRRVDFGVSPSTAITLWAAQPDPNDATQFSFRYSAGRLNGKIVGQRDLFGDGKLCDAIELRWEGGPIIP
jgi:hypothetical protein